MNIPPDEVPFLVTCGIVSSVGLVFALFGKSLFSWVAKISKYNILISRSRRHLMVDSKFILLMRIFFFVVSIGVIFYSISQIII